MSSTTSFYTPVRVEVSIPTPEILTKFTEFCSEHGLDLPSISAESFKARSLDTKPRIVTPEFKDLCGPSWLNPQGKISCKEIYEFLASYIKIRGLQQPNGVILADDELRNAFQIGLKKLYFHELPLIVQNVVIE